MIKNSTSTIFLLLWSRYTMAGEGASTVAKFPRIDPFSTESLLRVFGGLFVVLFLVIALIWVLKRLQSIPAGGGSGSVQLIAALALGQREKVVVVKLGEEQLVLGVTPGRIDRLHVLEKPLEQVQRTSVLSSSFAEKLKAVLAQSSSR